MNNKEIGDKIDLVREKAEQKKAVKYCFRGRKGKLAMELLEDICFINKPTYVKGDPQGTALNEGIRNTLLKIKELIKMPDAEIERKAEQKIETIRQYERNRNNGSTDFFTSIP